MTRNTLSRINFYQNRGCLFKGTINIIDNEFASSESNNLHKSPNLRYSRHAPLTFTCTYLLQNRSVGYITKST